MHTLISVLIIRKDTVHSLTLISALVLFLEEISILEEKILYFFLFAAAIFLWESIKLANCSVSDFCSPGRPSVCSMVRFSFVVIYWRWTLIACDRMQIRFDRKFYDFIILNFEIHLNRLPDRCLPLQAKSVIHHQCRWQFQCQYDSLIADTKWFPLRLVQLRPFVVFW